MALVWATEDGGKLWSVDQISSCAMGDRKAMMRARLQQKSRAMNLKFAADELRCDRRVVITAMLNYPGVCVAVFTMHTRWSCCIATFLATFQFEEVFTCRCADDSGVLFHADAVQHCGVLLKLLGVSFNSVGVEHMPPSTASASCCLCADPMLPVCCPYAGHVLAMCRGAGAVIYCLDKQLRAELTGLSKARLQDLLATADEVQARKDKFCKFEPKKDAGQCEPWPGLNVE